MHRSMLALALAAAGAGPAAAQVLPHPLRVERLENGLTVVLAPFDSPGIVAHYLAVRVGSRNEVDAGHTGFAHFFEHMMFRGTERFPADAYDRLLQSLGADNNAYTSNDHTCYTAVVPTAALPTLMDVEADRFMNLSYSLEAFQTEASTIWGEYLTSISDPALRMEEELLSAAFTVHPYGHTVIGWPDDIRAMPQSYDYSRDFFRRFYTPDNAFLIVAGDFDPETVLALAREEYGPWDRRLDAPPVPAEPEQTEPRQRHVEWPGPAPRRIFAAWKAPAFGVDTVEAAAVEVAMELLFGETSDLYRRLVVEDRRLLSLDRWPATERDPSLAVLDAKLADGTTFDEIVAAFQQAIDAAAEGAVDPARVEDVKSHVRYAIPMSIETPSRLAGWLARFVSATGDPNAIERYVARVGEVLPADVQRVARDWLGARHRTVVTLAPAPAAVAPAGEGGAP